MNVKNLLIETINKKYDYPVILQGSMNLEEEYPDHFFTFFNNDTMDDNFYDNANCSTIWDFDLNFYSIDAELVDTVHVELKQLLKNAGFIVDGRGYDLISDEVTHTGRGINVLYVEKIINKED